MRESLPTDVLVAMSCASDEQMAQIREVLHLPKAPVAGADEDAEAAPLGSGEGSDSGRRIAAKVFELLDALDSAQGLRKAPLLKVFNLYYRQDLAPAEIARRCECDRTLVFARLRTIKERLPWRPQQLRELSAQVEAMEASVRESRARHIHRKAAIEGDEQET